MHFRNVSCPCTSYSFSCGNVWFLIIVFSFIGGSDPCGELIKTPPPGISFFSPEVFLFGVLMVAGLYIG